ncbi:hypothetical protein ACEWY4_006367 [Coilia grayii]|uniref:B30.2/SPRY domain-containing protein n=1 Tax=Coilia grayii TaxID=363190 RepID=A0ABD1KDJ6_9TELE
MQQPRDYDTFYAIIIVLSVIVIYNFVPSLNYDSAGGTLDFNTVSPDLKITSDRTFAIRVSMRQPYPSHPARFDDIPQALTTECVSTGRYSWLVETQGHWDIGVAYKNISRKGTYRVRIGTNKESWSIRHDKTGRLFAFHDNLRAKIPKSLNSNMIQRIAVIVDFEGGVVSFAKKGRGLENLYAFKATFSQPVCLGLGLYSVNPQSTVTIV